MPTAQQLPFDLSLWRRQALLLSSEMKSAEERAFNDGLPSFDAMTKAGHAVVAEIAARWKGAHALILCGPGNNGGDGFIIADGLSRHGWNVTIAAMVLPDQLTGDAQIAAKKWWGKIITLAEIDISNVDLVVDALFGIGLVRPIQGEAASAIEKVAEAKCPKVSVDVPSGINSDFGTALGKPFKADLTVSFFRKKPGHYLIPGKEWAGEIVAVDIGIPDRVLDAIDPLIAGNAYELWQDIFPLPRADGHKYDRGHALIAGGTEMTGAARLAARAAQRIGAGLVSLAAQEKALPIYATALESVIVQQADTGAQWQELVSNPKMTAFLLGPGFGHGERQKDFILSALASGKPCVLDADALTLFSKAPDELFFKLNTKSVLTPHEGEFVRLFGGRIDPSLDKVARVRAAAKIAGCIILLKGADTVIGDPDARIVINANAPPSLAIAGAGDVLSGLILGLITQGMHAFAAAAAGAWIHGLIATRFGPGLIAEDLIDGIPQLLRGLSAPVRSV